MVIDTISFDLPEWCIQNPTNINEFHSLDFSIVPNPVRDIISITLTQHEPSPIKIELCDITGNCIATLFQGTFEAGTTTHNFNLTQMGFVAGTYIIRISDNTTIQSKQFIFAK
jgi:hypothetical protein